MEMTKTNFNEKNKELVELQQQSEKHADLVMEHAELQRKHNDLVKMWVITFLYYIFLIHFCRNSHLKMNECLKCLKLIV